jgi:hypothetical protein
MSMVAFGVPGGAPFGIATLLGSFFVGLFYPDTKPEPQPPPLTAAELTAALNSLKAGIIDAGWLKEVDDITNNLPGINQGLQDVWAGMLARNLDKQKLVMLNANGNEDPQFMTDTDNYFDLESAEAVGGTLTLLRDYRNILTMSSLNDPNLTASMVLAKRTQHTGVYILVCSITITYLKAALAWSWGSQLLKSCQSAAYQKALADYHDGVNKNSSYAKTHKLPVPADYPGVNTDPNYHPTWNDWVTAQKPFCASTMLIREVKAILAECVTIPADGETPAQDGFYTTMRTNWDDFERQISAFDVTVDAGQDPSTDQMATAIDQGIQRIIVWQNLLQKYCFDGVTEDDITGFEKAVDAWNSAAASANFTVYSVEDGDTLASIAKAKYGDASFADQIAGGNRDTLPSLTTTTSPLPKGLVLNIYDREALPYVQKPKGAQP